MARVDDDMAILGNDVVDLVIPEKALDHRHVDPSRSLLLPAAHLPYRLGISPQEQRKLRAPLIEQRPAVDEDQRRQLPSRCHVGADHGLPEARRGNQHTEIVFQHLGGRRLLRRRELSSELHLDRRAHRSPIVGPERGAVRLEQPPDVLDTASRQREMLREVLRTRDHARRERRR